MAGVRGKKHSGFEKEGLGVGGAGVSQAPNPKFTPYSSQMPDCVTFATCFAAKGLHRGSQGLLCVIVNPCNGRLRTQSARNRVHLPFLESHTTARSLHDCLGLSLGASLALDSI